jgi:hypothetical protein
MPGTAYFMGDSGVIFTRPCIVCAIVSGCSKISFSMKWV